MRSLSNTIEQYGLPRLPDYIHTDFDCASEKQLEKADHSIVASSEYEI